MWLNDEDRQIMYIKRAWVGAIAFTVLFGLAMYLLN